MIFSAEFRRRVFASGFVLFDNKFAFIFFYILVRSFLSVSSKVLFEITQRGEELGAIAAVEGLTVVESKMSSQSIACVESLFAATFSALERFDLGVNSDVDLQRVGCEEGLAATIFRAFEAVFTC